MFLRNAPFVVFALMLATESKADPGAPGAGAAKAAMALIEICTVSLAAGLLFVVLTAGLMGLAAVSLARQGGADELRGLAASVDAAPGRRFVAGLGAALVALLIASVLGRIGFGLLGLIVLGTISYGAALGLAGRALGVGVAVDPGGSPARQVAVGCPLLMAAGLFPIAGQVLLIASALQGLGAWCTGPATRCVAAGRAAVAAAGSPAVGAAATAVGPVAEAPSHPATPS